MEWAPVYSACFTIKWMYVCGVEWRCQTIKSTTLNEKEAKTDWNKLQDLWLKNSIHCKHLAQYAIGFDWIEKLVFLNNYFLIILWLQKILFKFTFKLQFASFNVGLNGPLGLLFLSLLNNHSCVLLCCHFW